MEWWDERPGFVSRVWRSEEMVVIVAPDHPWVDRPVECRVQGVPMLGGEPGTGTGRILAVTSVRSRAICKSACASAQPKR